MSDDSDIDPTLAYLALGAVAIVGLIGAAAWAGRSSNINIMKYALPATTLGAGGYPAPVVGFMRRYQDLEQRIADTYERGGTPARLEAEAAELLHHIEGMVAALEEEGGVEYHAPPVEIIEAAFAEAWLRSPTRSDLVHSLRELVGNSEADADQLVEAAQEAHEAREQHKTRLRTARGQQSPVWQARDFIRKAKRRTA